MTVLIITRSDDNECIHMVSKAIAERGGKAIRFDTDAFPTTVRLVARYASDGGGDGDELRLITPTGAHDLRRLTAVWHRRTRFGAGVPESLERQLRHASLSEAQATALGMVAALPAFQLDRWAAVRAASHKPLQWRVAREVGLEIPATLMTNDPEAVRAFARDFEGRIVAKMLSSFHVYEQGVEKVVFTTPVDPDALADLSGLAFSPMTFQERIAKRRELRVTIVGRRVFTAAIDSQQHERAREDWRREGVQLAGSWTVAALPPQIEQRLLRLMDAFGLNYGAIDLIETPDGRFVFLEINPVGEYFWLEHAPGLPISAAIADVLLGRAERRPSGWAPTAPADGGLP